MTQHSRKCILSGVCTLTTTPQCSAICPSYIAVHGLSGAGGRIGNAGLPAEYRMLTLATSPAKDAQAIGNDGVAYRAYALIERYVATFGRMFAAEDGGSECGTPNRIKSLYLYSAEPGLGKTTTAAAVLNEYIIVHYVGSLRRGLTPSERPAYYCDVNAWQKLYNGFTRQNVPKATAEPMAAEYYAIDARARNAAFAILDDIGVRDATEAFRADLHAIIEHRVSNGMPTIYTSNIPMTEQVRVFDRRLADRIRDMTAEIEYSGVSARGMR